MAWVDGWRRVRRAPAILLGVFALTFAAAVPFAIVMRSALATHLGSSLEAAAAADRANWNWWQEFISQASGLGATFTPRIVGFAATLDSLSAILDARLETRALLGLLAGYLALWTWLQGGVIDRFARQRPTRVRWLHRGQQRVLLSLPASRCDCRHRLLVAVHLSPSVAVR